MKKTKYLGIYLDEHLTWNFQLNQIKTKLNRSCGLLAKLRYVKTELLRTVYSAIFDSVLRYAVQVWGQHRNQAITEIEKLQEKAAIRIMSFKGRNDSANSLFKTLKIMMLKDILLYNNCILAHNQIN